MANGYLLWLLNVCWLFSAFEYYIFLEINSYAFRFGLLSRSVSPTLFGLKKN